MVSDVRSWEVVEVKMAEFSDGRLSRFANRDAVRSLIKRANSLARSARYSHEKLGHALVAVDSVLRNLEQSRSDDLYSRAAAAKVSILLRLGHFAQAQRWLGTQDLFSLSLASLMTKSALIAGDLGTAERRIITHIYNHPETSEKGKVPLKPPDVGYSVAGLLARSIALSQSEALFIQGEVTACKASLLDSRQKRSQEFYDRCAFILGVVEAKCFLTQGSSKDALEAVEHAAELLKTNRALYLSSAVPEFLAVQGEVHLLRRQFAAAARAFEELSVVFGVADDSPLFFKRAVWGLIEAYAGMGRSDYVMALKAVLAKRAGSKGALLADWCQVVSCYADSRMAIKVDQNLWARSIRAAIASRQMNDSEAFVVNMRRAYSMMVTLGDAKMVSIGTTVFTDMVQRLAQNPEQVGFIDTWNISRMFVRWYQIATEKGLVTRRDAAGQLLKIFGKAKVFEGMRGAYRLVLKTPQTESGAGDELVIEV